MTRAVSLYELAHARSGDKGNRLNIAVICREPRFFEPLRERLTEDFVARVFRERKPTAVKRYELPKLHAFNFVLDDVLDGGVNGSLGLDGHGKTLSFLLLAAEIEMPAALLAPTEEPSPELMSGGTR
uniref:AtuA-like ferredoxin-fold domain-containing protein n=1 Tax=Bosea sp. NBC_00436 TaxID=2969620 RepID=A0A9E8CMU9_9HYPH